MNKINRQLALMQLSDSFFPSGSYTLSHGLESLVQNGLVTTAEDVKQFLDILLHNKIGTCDLVALIHAYRGILSNNLEAIKTADRELFTRTLIQTNREAQIKSGRALLMVASSTWQDVWLESLKQLTATKQIYCLQPTVFAVVSRVAGLTESEAAIAFLHSLTTGLLGAAIRLGAIGHINSQQILTSLSEAIATVYLKAKSMTINEMSSCTPQIDLAQMQQQKLRMRLFAN
ncbi:urease accessory protein UreF [Myxosarcina sp. GI1]|uniref:urease accessory protein UreF n=1 Tax=Myxosarcina sp. GI1 TaxID=1541065 RepID=UPI00056AB217|nr:urease accessory UreF family protein [Myxosarcina sp. GI1]